MAVETEMPELMANAKSPKTFTFDVGCVENPEFIAVPEQHAGNSSGSIRLRADFDIAAGRDFEGINR
jgi:hypothetical protein